MPDRPISPFRFTETDPTAYRVLSAPENFLTVPLRWVKYTSTLFPAKRSNAIWMGSARALSMARALVWALVDLPTRGTYLNWFSATSGQEGTLNLPCAIAP